MKRRPLLSLVSSGALALVLAVVAAPACERYEPAPSPAIVGLEGGQLFDAKAPLVIDFGQPVDPSTLRFKVVVNETNIEGELGDEDTDEDTQLKVLLSHDPAEGDTNGAMELEEGGSRARFTMQAALPIGTKLLLVVEAGLKGTSGRTLNYRFKLPFAYTVRCVAGKSAKNLASGTYFALLEVQEPLGVQLQLYASFNVDPATGSIVAQFTNADRNPDRSRCPVPCGPADACRLLPKPECVIPSTKAGNVDEFSDFVPNSTPPIGYTFPVSGCAVDDGAGAGVVTAPAIIVVQQPAVTVQGITMNAYFAPDPSGRVRASGSLVADSVLLSGNRIGAGKGTMTAILLAAEETPRDVPLPDRNASGQSDAGASDAAR